MKAALVNLPYPYGRKVIYLNYSIVSVAARLAVVGHEATMVDLNIDEYEGSYAQRVFKESDLIGVSLLGAPSVPSAIAFTQRVGVELPGKSVAVGGQVIEHISRSGFDKMFGNKVKQIIDDRDFAEWIGVAVENIPHFLDISYSQVLRELGSEKLKLYLDGKEQSLIVSDGCVYGCTYCAARKLCRQSFRNTEALKDDVSYMVEQAKGFGVMFNYYASALDMCQESLEEMAERLEVIAKLWQELGIKIPVRCLSSMSTYLRALTQKRFSEFAKVFVEVVGTVGWGVDGSSERVWERLKKRHNKRWMVQECINLSRKWGQKAEILMVMGFPEDAPKDLWQTFKDSVRYGFRNKVLVRPYFAKIVPGSDGWPKIEKQFVDTPALFFDLDYCALGSRATHPRWWHRWLSNLTYLAIIALLTPFGKCDTLPLLPQGQKGLYGKIAKFVNRHIPSDR